ncbi:serine/arginine repetitive matrix protein 1 [Orussus abietinus]|uniref:serine/arginine repetitive matrix protein 1 n=1 Tax=Orussus abietinus TaxID=222816 RepID=UPI00062572A7|nr:serine/arginine repetitive matrix protein 1 [Orussus abietinus]XP_012284939.1 serine/arginine repetitive matrix protein 1 [Orussus abietinus]XP_012284940.1 serine/arginine repetitive matrix protein 1 [Orussus abietinus]XP_012284941.1 serine/arginine repetitive matrix protein 1 [Orussus abietinus]XP_012284942.1 serine/arginine repetitive matrix protein 1 [Orussus abietinus]XP_012284943.1 serine/arginine repetitive matrix protein 1 [Orussus abietinus]
MSRDYDSKRRGASSSGAGAGSSSSTTSKLRMDSNSSQTRAHERGESSGKRRELDCMMRKARESQSSYWNKKLLEVEERDPNRWRHSGYKELYVGGATSSEASRGHPRSPRSPRPRSPHSPRPRSPRPRSPRSPRERTRESTRDNRARPARSPSTGSTCSDKSCSVCSPKERRRVAAPSRSRSRSITPVRSRGHPKDVTPSSSRAPPPRGRPRSPPLPRPRTPPPAPQPPPRHHKDYKAVKEKETTKARRKEKHHSRIPEDPRIPDPVPVMRKAVKVEKIHTNHGPPPMLRPPPDSSPSDDSDSSSNASHVGPPRMTLSERFGKMAQWSVDRRDMENMRITKDGQNAMKVVIEGEERIARLGYDSPPPGHYPESLMSQGPRGLECWDDVRVRYDYYKARGYLRDLTLDDYIKWEEWWYKYQEWLEAERFYEQWANSSRSTSATGGGGSGSGRKRRGRRNNSAH